MSCVDRSKWLVTRWLRLACLGGADGSHLSECLVPRAFHFINNDLDSRVHTWHGSCKMDRDPSFSHRGPCPGGRPRGLGSSGVERRKEAAAREMATRPRIAALLTLLIAAVQLAGVPATPGAGRGPESARYFCCCAGECHCTADCCNHAPDPPEPGTSPGPKLTPDTPVLEAPRSCGMWTGTLTRGPEAPKALGAAAQRRTSVLPQASFRRRSEPGPADSSLPANGPSSPRAPPVSVRSS